VKCFFSWAPSAEASSAACEGPDFVLPRKVCGMSSPVGPLHLHLVLIDCRAWDSGLHILHPTPQGLGLRVYVPCALHPRPTCTLPGKLLRCQQCAAVSVVPTIKQCTAVPWGAGGWPQEGCGWAPAIWGGSWGTRCGTLHISHYRWWSRGTGLRHGR